MNRWLILVFLVLIFPFTARADQEGFTSYKMVSADSKYVFVMLHGKQRESDQYPQNGLYLNDGSKTPLWTVDWIAYVFLPSDGVHLVRSGGWAHQEDGYDAEAISFLAYGKVLKTYRVRDLIDFPSLLPHSSNHYEWRASGWASSLQPDAPVLLPFPNGERPYYPVGVSFDEAAHTMTLKTKHGNTFVFDVNSGAILSANRPVRRILSALLVLFLFVYSAYLWRAAKWPQKPFKRSVLFITLGAIPLAVTMLLLAMWGETSIRQPDQEFLFALSRFIWFWPWRYLQEFEGHVVLVSYQFRELQTLIVWFATFAGLGILHNRLVWMVSRADQKVRKPREVEI